MQNQYIDVNQLAQDIKTWGMQLGFQQVGIAHPNLKSAEENFEAWLAADYHGEMGYMSKHGHKRSRPASLIPGTQSILSARLDYLPELQSETRQLLDPSQQQRANISRYSLGRDYHKVMRNKLKKLALKIEDDIGAYNWRVFSDSAPVLEKPLAEQAGLGWIGKHTNLINAKAGSWFFLGEIYTDLALPTDLPATNHCGRCTTCIDICPTGAIVAPYQLDARRCISYLTIELHGPIPVKFRPLMGNRIYGCDDCQLFCPWNKFAQQTTESDFLPRHGLNSAELITLMNWDEGTFLARTEGSAIRRIGLERWQRNIAVALGNVPPPNDDVLNCLTSHRDNPSALVREHVAWALQQHEQTTV